MTGELVYVRGLRGPTPQKWSAGYAGGTTLAPLARHALSEAEWRLPIAELVRRYPPSSESQPRSRR